MTKNKYHNIKTVFNGKKYDSKKEAERAFELKLLEQKGMIKNLREQVPFVICPKIEGIKNSRARKYIADFVYEQDNKKIIEDVKSPITRKEKTYTLKKQLVMWQYPDFDFREV